MPTPHCHRPIPNELSIVSYMHCDLCLHEPPDGISPRDWARLEVGFTDLGLQVWCERHEVNVIHIDFLDHKHPANITRALS